MTFKRFAAVPFLISIAACNSGVGGPTGAALGLSNAPGCSVVSNAVAKDEGPYLIQKTVSLAEQNKGVVNKRLSGHIPRTVRGLQDQGKTSEDKVLPVMIALELNNQSELDGILSGMYEAGNKNYHQFISPEEFRARYAPTEDQVSRVQSFLQSQGIDAKSVSENNMLIRAEGSVRALNAAFHTEIHDYNGAKGVSNFAPAYELQLAEDLPIQGVHGLQNFTHLRRHDQAQTAKAAVPHGNGPSGGLSPKDIQTAYHVPTSVNGAGQTLAVFELDGYNASDISTYESNFGLPAVPLQTVLIDGASGIPGAGEAEVSLDIELMIAVAPGASKIMVYEGPNDDQGILDTYTKIANDNLAKQISTSWGTSEDGTTTSLIQSENNVFKQMAAQGQTIYAAAGDNGADDNGSSLSVDDPGSQPYVVGVGGTRLSIAADGTYQSETTWNTNGTAAGGGGGGGISTVWTQPSWQNGLSSAQSLGSSSMRNVPDVALEADLGSGYSIYTGGAWGVWGGTSCAAPLWAAFTALVNQQREASGKSSLGFANPVLYQIGRSSRYNSDFNDIKDGSTNIYYPAVTGYDDATGWGSFNGQNLLQDLVNEPSAGALNPACGTS